MLASQSIWGVLVHLTRLPHRASGKTPCSQDARGGEEGKQDCGKCGAHAGERLQGFGWASSARRGRSRGPWPGAARALPRAPSALGRPGRPASARGPRRLGARAVPAAGRGARGARGRPGRTRRAGRRASPPPRPGARAAVTSRAARQPRAPAGRARAAAEHMGPRAARARGCRAPEGRRGAASEDGPRRPPAPAPWISSRKGMLAAPVTCGDG